MKTLFTVLFTFILLSCMESEEQDAGLQVRKAGLNEGAQVDLGVFLADKLVRLEGDAWEPVKDFVAPEQFYVFYETASWCTSCQQYVSTLVSFYDLYSEIYGAQFEVIVVSYDEEEAAMLGAARSKKMRFPHLNLAQVPVLANQFPALGACLPNVIVTDLEGKVLKSALNSHGEYHGPKVAMNYLKARLDTK